MEECGLVVIPSFGNFVLVRFPADGIHDAASAMEFLTSRGIIPRSTASAGIPDGIRITVGVEDEMRAVADAVAEFMSQQ
jgi:histidinol-phosphate aminotransferase